MTNKKFLKDLTKNYWAISTIVLAIVLVIVLIMGNGTTLSANEVGQKVLTFANNQGANAQLVTVNDNGEFYEVVLSIDGQEVPVQATKDGTNLIPQLIPLTAQVSNTPTETEIPKSDQPQVELYVWAYCPYGVQAQDPMAEVANLLGNNADFIIVPYYDGHGAFETQENKIESCIQELEPEKYWDYAADFVTNIYPKCSAERTESCDLTESTALMKTLGINSDAVLDCVDSRGESLNAAASQKAQTNGVTGSPTIIINGVKANVARNADAIKIAVCNAFNNAPAECSEILDSTASASSGNC